MKYLTFISLLGAVIVSGILLNILTLNEATNFEEFALGEGTSSYFARYDGYPIHLDSLNQDVVDSIVTGWHHRGEKDVIFLFGNSQMHGINQYLNGQVSYNQILFDSLRADHDVLAQSIPNANLQEFLYLFQYWNTRVKISELVVPVFFDDMREDGIRFAYDAERNQSVYLKETTDPSRAWNAAVKEMQVAASAHPENAALANTVQEKTELMLDSLISAHSVTWRSRADMRGYLFTQLYLIRNRVFGINPQSVRRIIPTIYAKNFNALELLALRTQEAGIPLVFYIPPIRSDISIPYDPLEYDRFKTEIANLASKYSFITLRNLETAVDGKYWGMKESTAMGGNKLEYDFMHFSYAGHQALAQSLFHLIRQVPG